MSSIPYQRPPPPGMLVKPPSVHRLQPSNHQVSDYVQNHPNYYRDHPTARKPASPMPNGPELILKSYFLPHISPAVLPDEGAPKQYIFTGHEYTFKRGTRLDQHGIPLAKPQSTSEAAKHNGGPVRARPWEPKCISMAREELHSPNIKSSSRVHPSQYPETLVGGSSIHQTQRAPTLAACSVAGTDKITQAPSTSFTPDEERPKRTRFVPVGVHPDLRGGPGTANAVYFTNYDLKTDNDPFKHGKSYWGEPFSINTCNLGVLTGCK